MYIDPATSPTYKNLAGLTMQFGKACQGHYEFRQMYAAAPLVGIAPSTVASNVLGGGRHHCH
jgi:hypothetical protein